MFSETLMGNIMFLQLNYTATNAQVSASPYVIDNLQQNKTISGRVRMASDSTLTTACSMLSTDLLKVDYRNLLSTELLQVVLASCNKCANNK